MYLDNLGEIIAIRELFVLLERNEKKKVTVFIGKPRPFSDADGYYCPFQIVGIGGEEIKYAAGIDAIQSLQLVMIILGATLQFLNDQVGGSLRWEGSTGGDLGFPSTSNN